jgi:hypothetical protein
MHTGACVMLENHLEYMYAAASLAALCCGGHLAAAAHLAGLRPEPAQLLRLSVEKLRSSADRAPTALARTCSASSFEKGGIRSCNTSSSVMYSGGSTSGREDSAWPICSQQTSGKLFETPYDCS